MRFQLISDIHGRFGKVKWDEEADLVLCAGDVSENPVEAIKFLKKAKAPVIYIPGNHEFYKGNFVEREDYLREECEKSHGAITYANNQTFYLDDVRIVSTTLWTNYNHFDPLLVSSSEHRMNDYNYIKTTGFFDRYPELFKEYQEIYNNYRKDIQAILRGKNQFNIHFVLNQLKEIHDKFDLQFDNVKDMLEGMPYRQNMFSPAFSYLLHQQSYKFLENELSTYHEGKTLVMTHHAPSYTALSMSRFAVDVKAVEMLPVLKRAVAPNKIGAYATSMENLAMKYDIDGWVHGHLHDRMLYRLGSATVHCNATGIPRNSEKRTGYDTYSFYLNDDFKRQGLLNLLNHADYKLKKVNLFLIYVLQNKLVDKVFDDIDKLKSVFAEGFYPLRTLRSTESKDILKDVQNFNNLYIGESKDSIIKKIIRQNQEIRHSLQEKIAKL